jgi:prepilin-type processing-associated H-X9-DG protein
MNNERAQVVGAHLYAGEASGKLSGLADPSDTDLNWLRPFVGGLDTLRHPVVRNVIRPDIVLPVQSEWYRERLLGMTEVMADLAWNTETRGGHGVGYVTLGFMWTGGWTHNQVRKTYGEFGQQLWLGILKTESNTAGWVHRNEALGLKGQTVGPDQIFHTVDVDLDMSGHRGYPDKGDPHGEANNVAFVDGHVELVSAKKWIKWSSDCPAVSEYLYRYERSGDANLSAPQPEDHSLIEWRHLWLKKL